MSSSIKKEYEKLLSRYHFIKRELLVLPLGYVSKKTINGKVQYYLQRRVGKYADMSALQDFVFRREVGGA